MTKRFLATLASDGMTTLTTNQGDATQACRQPCGLDGGDVDLRHRHHRFEGPLGLIATSGKRVGQHARRDLPGEAPAILTPTALAFLAAIADDRVPVASRAVVIHYI